MITLTKGLKNSLIVLEHLRNDEEFCIIADICIGTFTNCREQGLTFVVTGTQKDGDYIPIEYFTFCIYEHRNSDCIIINGKKGYVSLNGDLPYMADDKYKYIAEFNYNQHYECAEKLKELILDWINISVAKYEANKNLHKKQ